jgi:hypothetical protein
LIEDIYEPLSRYRDEFCEKFKKLTIEKFRELAVRSKINFSANRKLVEEIKKLQSKADKAHIKKMCYGWLMGIFFVLAIASIIGVSLYKTDTKIQNICFLGTAVGFIIGIILIPLYRNASKLLKSLNVLIESKKQRAWEQMSPLNDLYTWDITSKLIEKTVPKLQFDPYFSAYRLEELHQQYGWDHTFNDDKSILFAQSGEINGNPFVFGHYLDMEWGEKTYEGTKEISWTEMEKGSDGKVHFVRRYETLHATVTKPIPVYTEQKFLLYGNDAAPNLSFSREPSGLSGKDGELLTFIRKKWRLNRLKAYSRDLTDDSNFTLMSNHEFETWFHAKDRDDEVEFRLLFTPIAQNQLLNLMRDTKIGFGDDFTFVKQRKVNFLSSLHLNEANINTDPSQFYNWDFDAAYASFVSFNVNYFRHIYFALAPILSIPLYQQMRTHEKIWEGIIDFDRKASSFWEHESVANYYGDDKFKHPSCITRSILKTKLVKRQDGESTIAVTAHGYKGEERVDYESVYGSDGKTHKVPVRWIQYYPVNKTSNMCLTEETEPSDGFNERIKSSTEAAFRRSILSFRE